jgi:hypothetical protein
MATERPKLDLKANLPAVAVLKYADHRSTRYGDKVKCVLELKGSEHYAAGEYELFASEGAKANLLELGAITERAGQDGTPQYAVKRGLTLSVLKTEQKTEDGKTVYPIRFEVVGGTPAAPPATKPVATTTVHTGNGHAPAPAPAPAGVDPKAIAKAWVHVGEEYGAALALARHHLSEQGVDLEPGALQAAAATILIRAEKAGLLGQGFRGFARRMTAYLAHEGEA